MLTMSVGKIISANSFPTLCQEKQQRPYIPHIYV